MDILELKNVASGVRSLLDWSNSRLGMAEDRISEERSKEDIQTYAHRGKMRGAGAEWTSQMHHAWEVNMHVTGVHKEKGEWDRAIIEEIMTKNFQNLVKDTEVQNFQQTSSMIHIKKSSSKQIIVKLQKIKAYV